MLIPHRSQNASTWDYHALATQARHLRPSRATKKTMAPTARRLVLQRRQRQKELRFLIGQYLYGQSNAAEISLAYSPEHQSWPAPRLSCSSGNHRSFKRSNRLQMQLPEVLLRSSEICKCACQSLCVVSILCLVLLPLAIHCHLLPVQSCRPSPGATDILAVLL